MPKEPTHFVKTNNPSHRLALRISPSYVEVSKNAEEDSHLKGALVVMMPPTTILRIIKPHLGYNCEWHQVEVIDDNPNLSVARDKQQLLPLYCFAEFVAPMDGTPHLLPTNCIRCTDTVTPKYAPIITPDWTKLDECEPFFDELNCEYCITLTTEETTLTADIFQNLKNQYLRVGVERLLEYHNKKRDSDFVEHLMSSYSFAYIPDYGKYLDQRPGSLVKILVRIPSKYFDAIPSEKDCLEDIPTTKGGLPPGWRVKTVSLSSFKKNIDIVAKRFEEYTTEIEKWGTIEDFNIKEETKRLRSVPGAFRKFIELNGFQVDENSDDSLELGFEGPCFNLAYVLLNIEGLSGPLRKGFTCFRGKDPIANQRTMGYVFYLDEMVKDIKKSKRAWIPFIQDYSCPIPKIRPSTKKEPELGDKLVNFEGKLVKNNKEKESEDEYLDTTSLKQSLYDLRKNVIEFNGDTILSCDNVPAMLDRIDSIEDIYTEVLNKIDLQDVLKFAASCAGADITNIPKIACKMVLGQFGEKELRSLLDYLPLEKISETQKKLIESLGEPGFVGIETGEINESNRIRSVFNEVFSEQEICEAINLFDPKRIDALIELLSPPTLKDLESFVRRIINIPTIVLPDTFPVENIMSQIGEIIVESIKRVLSQILMSVIKEIFMRLCDTLCSENNLEENYGEEDFRNFFGNPNEIERKASNDFDIPIASIRSFFDDISNVLLPTEICSLLQGTATEETIRVVKGILSARHQDLYQKLKYEGKIREFFILLGKRMNPQICDDIQQRIIKTPAKDLCEMDIQEIRKSLLSEKMDSDLIDQQLKEIKKRNEEIFSHLGSLLDDQFLNKLLPPTGKGICGGGSRKPIIDLRQPSVEILNDRVFNAIFDGIRISFNYDINGFVSSLISAERDKNSNTFTISREEYKESLKVLNKLQTDFDNFNESDTEKLLRDPDQSGAGRGKKIVSVAPDVKQQLKRGANFVSSQRDGLRYLYRTDYKNAEEKLEESERKAFLGRKDKISKLNSILEKFGQKKKKEISLTPKGGFEYSTPERKTICLPELDNSNDKIKSFIDSLADQGTVIEYKLDNYKLYNEIKDKYQVRINSPLLPEPFDIDVEEKLPEEIKDIIKHIDKTKLNNLPTQQGIFTQILSNAIKKESKKSKLFDPGGAVYEFFRVNSFDNITKSLMREITNQIANSRLFDVSELQNIDFTPDERDELLKTICPPISGGEDPGLLNISEIMSQARKDYDKYIDTCILSREGREKLEPFESSNINAIILLIIRLFVIDSLLKSIFVFSEFDVKGLLNDKYFYKYMYKNIENSIKSVGDGFYEKFLTEVNRVAEERNIKDDKEKIKYNDGDYAIEFFIKENIKSVSESLSRILKTRKERIEKRIVGEFIPVVKMFNKPKELRDFLSNQNKTEFGSLVFQEYVRNCVDNSVSSDSRDQKVKGSPFVYGLRLSYIPKQDKSIFKDLPLRNINDNDKEHSVIFREDLSQFKSRKKAIEKLSNIVSSPGINQIGNILKYLSVFGNNVFVNKTNNIVSDAYNLVKNGIERDEAYEIPLLWVEEDSERKEKIRDNKEKEKLIESLKEKIINTRDFKMFFDFLFPVSRFITLGSIYTSIMTSVYVENIDDIFNSTRYNLKTILQIISPGEVWWKKGIQEIDSRGGNLGFLQERMSNISPSGSHPSLFYIAKMTIPLIIKGLAEKFDASYAFSKYLFDLGITKLNWSDIFITGPINFFGPFGWGPPLGPLGQLAYTLELLPGEKKKKFEIDMKDKLKNLSPEEIKKLCEGDK